MIPFGCGNDKFTYKAKEEMIPFGCGNNNFIYKAKEGMIPLTRERSAYGCGWRSGLRAFFFLFSFRNAPCSVRNSHNHRAILWVSPGTRGALLTCSWHGGSSVVCSVICSSNNADNGIEKQTNKQTTTTTTKKNNNRQNKTKQKTVSSRELEKLISLVGENPALYGKPRWEQGRSPTRESVVLRHPGQYWGDEITVEPRFLPSAVERSEAKAGRRRRFVMVTTVRFGYP